MDMDFSVIRNLTDQAQRINNIEFTGGEPTLNAGAIRYTLEAVKEKQIPVRQIRIVTNGVLKSQDLVDVLIEWADYIIPEWRYAEEMPIILGISRDKYHIGGDPIGAERFYWWAIHDIASIEWEKSAEYPAAIGRAKNLPEAYPPRLIGQYPRRIELWECGKESSCPQNTTVKAPQEGETIVLCPLLISANGNVSRAVFIGGDYDTADRNHAEILCNLSDPVNLYDAIAAYNNGKKLCGEVRRQEEMCTLAQIFAAKDPLKAAFGKPAPVVKRELETAMSDFKDQMTALAAFFAKRKEV